MARKTAPPRARRAVAPERLPIGYSARMYLRQLRVKNVKLLRDVSIDFTRPDGSTRLWTVFVGENRLCKTTLLQVIAAAASGREGAVHLTTNVIAGWPDLRRSADIHIQANFDAQRDDGALPGVTSMLDLTQGSTLLSGRAEDAQVAALGIRSGRHDPLLEARRARKKSWIVLGYGTRRSLGASPDLSSLDNPHLDRLRGLFGSEILGTRFIELLDPDLGKTFVKTLQRVLVEGGLLPNVTDLELRGRGGIKSNQHLTESQRFEMNVKNDQGANIRVPATWLSQGYQSVIAWVADIVGQILLDHGEPMEPEDMVGCVLVDELDLHLHPTWQVRLIPALKKVFPRLQFIATTHSPMMLPGLEADEIHLLTQDADGSVVSTPSDRSPALMTGSELYEAFFAITKLYPNDLGAKSKRYLWLSNDPTRDSQEDREMQDLRVELDARGVTYDWDPVPREDDV